MYLCAFVQVQKTLQIEYNLNTRQLRLMVDSQFQLEYQFNKEKWKVEAPAKKAH